MRYLSMFSVFSVALSVAAASATTYATPAQADAVISGPACILDGNSIQVGGKIKDGACWGGINVRLHGSIAPALKDTCPRANGSRWDCGEVAKGALSTMIRMSSVTCYHVDGEFDANMPVTTCLSGHQDLALAMVEKCMAKALHDQSNRYALEEQDAKAGRRGLWQ